MSGRRARLRPEAEAAQFILSGVDKPGLKVQWVSDCKGRGVFACAPIEKGSFVVEYRGELISQHERDKRQKKYTEKQNAFLFDFEWNSSTWCIDASREDGSLGRLVNDAHKSPNCKMKKLTVQGKPHLCLFAIENIQADSEITYNYGESQWPWRALQTPNVQIPTQSSADQEVSEVSTSSFQQETSSYGLAQQL
ncbi:N-lysine methyltransferase KMT5A-A-like [Chelmon rostratus]|uniref:N-lysine methyltransferase KMT5A-A-like n=1 Tax=Chelmon rostratus TaxID=109905 RepID=UPI001BEA4643|nr:N-lysine methyltransferase KMT5A-A-like [Chelmon rostratus]